MISIITFSIPCIIVVLLALLPPSRTSDPGSHNRLFHLPPATVHALIFYLDKGSALSSAVDSRRIVPTHAMICLVLSTVGVV